MPGPTNPSAMRSDRRYAIAQRVLSPQEVEGLSPPAPQSGKGTSILEGPPTLPEALEGTHPADDTNLLAMSGPPQEIRPIRWTAYGQDYEINPQSGRIATTSPEGKPYDMGPFDEGDEYANAVNAYYQQTGADVGAMSRLLGFHKQ